MDIDLSIECECGYVIHFGEKDRGTTYECSNCTASLILDSDEPEVVLSETAEEAVASNTQPSPSSQPAYSSPFEDDEDDEPHTPLPMASQSIASPLPSAPSPPKDDIASTYFEEPSQAHSSEEAVPKPDPSLLRQYEGIEHTSRYQQLDESDTCPRCGNPFRGDWDKQSLQGKTLCFICSNQATEGMPERASIQKFSSTDHLEDGSRQMAQLEYDLPTVQGHAGGVEKFWLFNPESEEFQKMIYFLAFGMIFLTVYLIFTIDMDISSTRDSGASERVAEAEVTYLPGWARFVLGGWGVFTYLATYILAAYFVLRLTDRMPHDYFPHDIGLIAVALSPLFIGQLIIALIVTGQNTDVLSDALERSIAIFVFVPSVIITLLTLMKLLDFRLRDFIYLVFVKIIVNKFLIFLGLAVYAAVAQGVL